MSLKKLFYIILSAALLMPYSSVWAQKSEQRDSLVKLINAESIRLLERDGQPFREVVKGRFLHNNTYFICDTALWNVNDQLIDAFGNVQLLQDRTSLTSETMTYSANTNIAVFRGGIVELKDKDNNLLRTSHLDYNTKDSLAYFERGASMKAKDGQVIESFIGEYDSKIKRFFFNRDVKMYTDSVFISTSKLYYYSDTDEAEFEGGINAWKDKSMISSQSGRYVRPREDFFFKSDVHLMSESQEGWSDSLLFNRLYSDIDMRGNVQVMDTVKNVVALTDRLTYVDSLSLLNMIGNAAIVAVTKQEDVVDTVWFGSDRFIYRTVPRCDIDQAELSKSEARLKLLESDPVASYRKKAAAVAASAKEASKKNVKTNLDAIKGDAIDSLKVEPDELQAETTVPDSISVDIPVEMAEEKKDTTAIGFFRAVGAAKLFRMDMQVLCDSLEYSDLDSLARLFKSPIIWNEGDRQYSADSIYISVKGQKMDKANLMSNAFIIIEEKPELLYDQIKGTEVVAYFDTTTMLKRFDALGGANAMFFLKENEEFATVNTVESRMLSANFDNGEIQTVYYFDNPKNNAYPVVQFPDEERFMKGYNWRPDLRPKDHSDITKLELRSTQRTHYLSIPMPQFWETDKYFPGHIETIKEMLAQAEKDRIARRNAIASTEADSMAVDSMAVDSLEKVELQDSLVFESDTIKIGSDTLAIDNDIVIEDILDSKDTVSVDTLSISDSIGNLLEQQMEADQKKAAERAARREAAEKKRADRLAAKEARWEELDLRDSIRQARKDGKKLEKQRKKTLKAVLHNEKVEARNQKLLHKYVERMLKKKQASEMKAKKKN